MRRKGKTEIKQKEKQFKEYVKKMGRQGKREASKKKENYKGKKNE